MIFSYNWLQSFFSKKLPKPEEIAEVLTIYSFEAKVLKETRFLSGTKDVVLDIDILPNRAHDCYSHLGIAREISALLSLNLNSPIGGLNSPKRPKTKNFKLKDRLEIDVKEPDLCRRYIAGAMTNVKVGPSPGWLEERLIAIGQKSVNNIVDAANYAMLETGQPLHVFDFDKVSGVQNQKSKKCIVVRRAKKGEKITSLDNNNFALDTDILVIADSREPLAIAGIKGGKKAEIDSKTKNIIIESANFEPTNIRLTSRKIGLVTGSSISFENEISPALAKAAMDRATALIQEIAGGEIIGERIDFYPKKFKSARIIFKPDDISKFLGISVSEKEIFSTLKKLGFEVKKSKENFIVSGPAERLDLNIKEDVGEEIARIRGYGKIPSKAPEGLLFPVPPNDKRRCENMIKNLLAAAGLSEVYNYSFAKAGEIEIENPIAGDKKFLRANLLDGLKDTAGQNFRYFDEVKIFEMGKVFRRSGSGAKFGDMIEKNKLAGLTAYKAPKPAKEIFYETKGILENVISSLGISDYWFDDSPDTEEIKTGRPMAKAEVKIGNESIGYIDKDSFEIDLDKLILLASEEREFRPFSKYPAVIRDIAILVSPKTKISEALDAIQSAGGELLMDVDLFDVYEREETGRARKSLAFHLIFQSNEKTLSDKEANALMEKIIKALEDKREWEVRR